MARCAGASGWTRHLVYRAERTRTTWKLRVGVLVLLVAVLLLSRAWWTAAIGRSLVCSGSLAASDAILIENFESRYLVYERARNLRRAGLASRVLVPISIDPSTQEPNLVSLGTAELMARLSRLGEYEVVPVREVEPITLNATRDVQRFLEREHLHSLIVVTPLFRSRRSMLVYESVLRDDGIAVRCQPADGSRGVETWSRSWHGIQEVVEQWLKLQYYRLYVLPRYA